MGFHMAFDRPGRRPALRTRNRAAVMAELRRLMPGMGRAGKALPFGLAAINSHLPDGGLTRGALHEVVPAAEGSIAAAFGFIAAILARLRRLHPSFYRARLWPSPLPLPRPAAWPWPQRARSRSRPPDPGRDRAPRGNAVGHGGSGALGGTRRRRRRHRHARSEIEPAAASRGHRGRCAAVSAAAGAPHPSPPEGSAAATRWRIGTAQAARDRFGLVTQPRWDLQLERCRNGRPGEWVVEYDHVAHRFSLAAALADFSRARGAGEKSIETSQLIRTVRSSSLSLPLQAARASPP